MVTRCAILPLLPSRPVFISNAGFMYLKNKHTYISKTIHRTLSAVLTGVLFLSIAYPVYASPISASELIAQTNEERVAEGLPELVPNHMLTQAAQRKALDMLKQGYFAHTTPAGKPFYHWIEEERYNYLYAGENLAIDFETTEGVLKAWMNSPLHKANIVNEHYTDIGMVAVRGEWQDHETTVVVQMFGSLLLDAPTVLGQTLQQLSQDFRIRKDSLETIASDLVMLPSIAGPTYFDVMLQSPKQTQLVASNIQPEHIAASPTTKIAQQETYRTLLKTEQDCCYVSPTFALTEEQQGNTVSTPITYPSVANLIQNIGKRASIFNPLPDALYTNVLLTGLLLLLLIGAYYTDIKKHCASPQKV